ncbi:peptide synthetase [Nocardia terpenica]|uniref:Peptide synthetase n=1 Tax=Nocardia terpenica TaxID=455432 RepID=A0A291RQQ2_9NOCA|nr:peptide synthetase [Nocardia terpenica]ATL69620.1 peptide synthetase [Nocardia terpenica]
MSTVFRRRISPTELMYFPMRDMAPPFLMQLMFRGEGALSAAELQRAVTVAAAACPGARLVRDGADWVDSGVPPRVREVTGHTLNFPRLEEDSVLTSPIGPTADTTCEVLLLTGQAIVFRVFHGVMDGMGMVQWATNVFRVLRGESPLPYPDPVADTELVRRVGAPGRPTPMVPRFRAATGHGRQDPGLARHLLRHRVIEATGPGAVARVAALLAETTGTVSRIMVPVDLRRHAPELRSTANLALPLFLDVRPGQSWEQINADKRIGLRERRELNQMASSGLAIPPAAGRSLLRTLNWLGARSGRNLASATVSHMGRFDLDELTVPGFAPTGVCILPQHSVAMPLLFGMVEAGGHTHLTVSARNGRGVEPRLEALLDRIAATLAAELPQRDSVAP